MPYQDEWEADSEWEDEGFAESDDEEACIACPHCQKQIHEDSQQCPYCQNYITAEDVRASRKLTWLIIIGAGLCLYVVFRWIVD
jgi:uncharacterized paraquat-inducible protein A